MMRDIQKGVSGLPADIAGVIEKFDARPKQRAMRRMFDASRVAGTTSVILAHFDSLREAGYPNAAHRAVQEWWNQRDEKIGWEHQFERTARRLVLSALPGEG